MTSSRNQILEFLHKNHMASATDLSRSLQLTKADVRYHLNALLELNLVEKAALRKSINKGRPTQLFRISSHNLPENYASLAEGLLNSLLTSGADRSGLVKIADYFARQIPHPKLPTQQLTRLTSFLTDHGHMARWEAYTNGPRILFRNCPYAQILPGHPELCVMDERIISIYLGQPFIQTARIDPDNGKIPACVFTLRK
jgi:predicted ArsR family transcriptional regulator